MTAGVGGDGRPVLVVGPGDEIWAGGINVHSLLNPTLMHLRYDLLSGGVLIGGLGWSLMECHAEVEKVGGSERLLLAPDSTGSSARSRSEMSPALLVFLFSGAQPSSVDPVSFSVESRWVDRRVMVCFGRRCIFLYLAGYERRVEYAMGSSER